MSEPQPQETELQIRNRLRGLICDDFDVFEEVNLSHSLFRHRLLRADLVAIPRDPKMSDIAIAFETKKDQDWDIPSWGAALKQASDYVLATIHKDRPQIAPHAGKRVMAVFMFPCASRQNWGACDDVREAALSGMSHLAASFRVGVARSVNYGRVERIALMVPNEVWVAGRGWRSDARNILVGKRQIGSQRFPILEELDRIARGDQ